jgi:hypothetical protein
MNKPVSFLNRLALSPAGVTLFVSLIYLGVVLFRAGGDPLEFARIGTRFSQGDPAGTEGYDGQFVYYIALDLDPARVSEHLDLPAYRYQRILLPVLARTLSFGSEELLPWILPAIGLLAHTIAVLLLTDLMESWRVNRWYALVYALWPGILLALRLDLPEPLAFGLVIATIWSNEKGRSFAASICFGLALFAKETTLPFIGAYLISFLFQKRWANAIALTLIAFVPFAFFRFWLLQQFGETGFSLGGVEASPPEVIPFMGLWRIGQFDQIYFLALLIAYLPSIIVPTVWALWSSVKRLAAKDVDPVILALLANAAILPFMPLPLFISTGGTVRLATGLVLAALLFVARFNLARPLKYIPLWLAMNAVLLQEFFGPNLP